MGQRSSPISTLITLRPNYIPYIYMEPVLGVVRLVDVWAVVPKVLLMEGQSGVHNFCKPEREGNHSMAFLRLLPSISNILRDPKYPTIPWNYGTTVYSGHSRCLASTVVSS